MTTADQAVAIFDSFVGITENPPHSNKTVIGMEFGWNGVAWCAETCSVVLNRAFGRKIIWTASVAQVISDAKAGRNGLRWVSKNDTIRKGDLVTYDFGGHGDPGDFHIAMVRDPGTQSKFQTDGGNEQDAVRQQWRDKTYVQGFARPPYDSQPLEEDDLTGEQNTRLINAERDAGIARGEAFAAKEGVHALQVDVAAIKAALQAGAGGAPIDVNAIAKQTAAELAERLKA